MELSDAKNILANLASHGIDNTDYGEDEIIEACEVILIHLGDKITWKEGI